MQIKWPRNRTINIVFHGHSVPAGYFKIRSTDFVARVGGDEFAVIMENIASGADLLKIGEKISVALNLPLRIEGRALSGGASIGGALFPLDAANANDLFKLADTALFML